MRHVGVAVCMINVILLYSGLSYSCNRAEYEINGECCPMCPSGTRVYKHCTEYTSTSCTPCIGKTFTDEPNGLPSCLPCKVCDIGLSLKTESECTPSSNTVCGPLAQHYCVVPDEKGCRLAQRHTICKPGEFIKQNGTTSTDTVCEACPDNTFSDGLYTSCKPHTNCQSLGLIEHEKGNQFLDSECGRGRVRIGLYPSLGIGAFCSIVPFILILHRKGQRTKKPQTQPKLGEIMIQDGGKGFQTVIGAIDCSHIPIIAALRKHEAD